MPTFVQPPGGQLENPGAPPPCTPRITILGSCTLSANASDAHNSDSRTSKQMRDIFIEIILSCIYRTRFCRRAPTPTRQGSVARLAAYSSAVKDIMRILLWNSWRHANSCATSANSASGAANHCSSRPEIRWRSIRPTRTVVGQEKSRSPKTPAVQLAGCPDKT